MKTRRLELKVLWKIAARARAQYSLSKANLSVRHVRREIPIGEQAYLLMLVDQLHLDVEEKGGVREHCLAHFVAALLVARGRHQKPAREVLHNERIRMRK